jgi:hypothetical protein
VSDIQTTLLINQVRGSYSIEGGPIDRHKGPATTGPAAQSDNMTKGDMSKDTMSKKKKSRSAKTKKTGHKM